MNFDQLLVRRDSRTARAQLLKERQLAHRRRYRKRNHAKILKREAAWRAKNRFKLAQWQVYYRKRKKRERS